jgi:formamidopyrimidine-DNA glycosylase
MRKRYAKLSLYNVPNIKPNLRGSGKMNEIPESVNIAWQMNQTAAGKRIRSVESAHTPHKLVAYFGKPGEYNELLAGKVTGKAVAIGGMVEVKTGNVILLLGEGLNIRYHAQGEARPLKHQLLIEFEDGCGLSAAVQMYGGLGVFPDGTLENRYYLAAKNALSPLADAFDKAYFYRMINTGAVQNLSLKAFLATEQRIPGLGNGILQDILFRAKIHPKKKVNALSESNKEALFSAIKTTIKAMADKGGRDTEMDLFGKPGGYKTILSKNTVDKPCPVCGTPIKKEAYLGGNVYYCGTCQQV